MNEYVLVRCFSLLLIPFTFIIQRIKPQIPSISLSRGIPERSLIIRTSALRAMSLPNGELSILNSGANSGRRFRRSGYCFSKSCNRVSGVISVIGTVSPASS